MLSQSRQNPNQSVAASLVAFVCVFAVGLLQVPQLNQLKTRAKNTPPEIQKEVESEKLRLNLLNKIPTFGFNNLLGDWVYLGFLQYFGDDEARQRTDYKLSPDYFNVIVTRDPLFLGAYIGLSTSISMYAGMPQESVALMNRGLQSMSPEAPQKSYYVWRYKGTDELLFLGDSQAARQSFEKAADWASVYSDPESKNVVEISRQTAQFLARKPSSRFAQISAWSMVLTNAVDNRTRKIAISHIEALGGKVIISPDGGLKVQLPPKD